MTTELRLYPGYEGVHTRDQAAGALPNESRVVKIYAERGSVRPVGSLATIIGSIEADLEDTVKYGVRYLYFVEWDDLPGVVVAVADIRIEAKPPN
jgi:hypothetical protein